MKNYVLPMSALVFMTVITACGVSTIDRTRTYNSDRSSFTYEYDSGCNTGKHTFPNEQDYCEGLRSASLNNGQNCSSDLRRKDYENRCGGGKFTQTP